MKLTYLFTRTRLIAGGSWTLLVLGAVFLFAALWSLPAVYAGQQGTGPNAPEFLPGRVIVKLKQNPTGPYKSAQLQSLGLSAKLQAVLQAANVQQMQRIFPEAVRGDGLEANLARLFELRFDDNANLANLIALLQSDAAVEYAEPVYIRRLSYTPNDPGIPSQYYLDTVKAKDAWNIGRGDPGVLIAVVDTGVDWQHPDLAAHIWRNPVEIPNNGIDDDRNGFIDDIRGWDFGNDDNNPKNDTESGLSSHGTFVAGLVSAVTDNGIGIAGLGFNCTILPIKASFDGSEDPGQGIIFGFRGIKYAADNGADIINLSWGSGSASQAEQEVVDYATAKGALVVAAAGNENSEAMLFPAGYPHVLSVAATQANDQRANFSNYGFWVDIAAPGVSIYSTVPDSGYQYSSGTSFSSPITAGIAGLVQAQHPDWLPDAIGEQLRNTADNINDANPGYANKLGKGRVNAFRALSEITPGMRIISHRFSDVEGGDGDGILEPGETITVHWTLVNYLEPVSGLQVQLTTEDLFMQIQNGSVFPRSLSRNDTLAGEPFTFKIGGNTPKGHLADFMFMFNTGAFSDYQPTAIVVQPLYADFVTQKLATTLSAFGAVGFLDYAKTENLVGLGFQFPRGNASALFHGSFMVATAADAVSDVAYGNQAHTLYDFEVTEGGDIVFNQDGLAPLQAEMEFTDAPAENPVGVRILEKVYGWNDPPNDGFIILEYSIENTSGATIENLYAAEYLDWDIREATQNQPGYDAETEVGYMFSDSSNYYGLSAVEPASASHYSAVLNPDYVWPPADFTDAIKFQFISGQTQVLASDSLNDWSQMISFGPYTLAPGETKKVALAIVAGETVEAIKQSAIAARQVYITTAVEDGGSPLPEQFALQQNTPNPFRLSAGAGTSIVFRLEQPEPVKLVVYNLLGQEVVTLLDETVRPGQHRLHWNGRDATGRQVAPGIYLYRLRTASRALVRKLVILP